MSKTKRKIKTSTEVKARYNQKTYGSIPVGFPKELVAEFKSKCADEGISQAQIIK